MAKELSHLVRGGALHERWGKLTDGLSTVRVLSPPQPCTQGRLLWGTESGTFACSLQSPTAKGSQAELLCKD